MSYDVRCIVALHMGANSVFPQRSVTLPIAPQIGMWVHLDDEDGEDLIDFQIAEVVLYARTGEIAISPTAQHCRDVGDFAERVEEYRARGWRV